MILQFLPLNVTVNFPLLLTFHLLLLLLQIDTKENALILLRIFKSKREKKNQRTQLFKKMHSYCKKAIKTAVEKSHNVEIRAHPTFIRPTAGN